MSATAWPKYRSLGIPDLSEYCQKVNQRLEEREKRYLDLLELLERAITTSFKKEDLKTSALSGKIIFQNIPADVKELENIAKKIKFCKLVFKNQNKILDLRNKLGKDVSYGDSDILNKVDLLRFASHHHVSLGDDSVYGGDCARVRKERKIHSILSIDGGGIRGIIPASMLVKIEEITSKPISDLFDLIGGTSTGGILALGLTVPSSGDPKKPRYTADNLLRLYTDEHESIFSPNPNYCLPSKSLFFFEQQDFKIKNPKYVCPMPLFDTKFHSSYMSSALTDVLITTNREEKVIQEMGTIMIAGIGSIFTLIADRTVISNHSFPKDTHFFTKTGLSRLSYSLKGLEDFYNGEIPSEKASSFPYAVSPEEENDFKMAFVAKSTSAAPTYFPRSILYEKRLLDGGLLQNNPAVPCVLSALEKHHRNNLFMVSLGTGELSDKKLSYGDPLSFWFDLTQPSERTEDLLEDILPIGGYHRFQYRFTTTPPDLDEVGAIQDLVEKGKELVEEKADYLRYVCKVLAPDSI